MTTRMTVALALPAILLLSGCDELQQLVPTVRFDTMRVIAVDFDHIEADFVFQVDNPNPVDIKLASFSYALGLQEIELLRGDADDGLELRAVGASEVVLPASLKWQETWDTVQAVRGSDDVEFALDGDFGFDTPIGLVDLPYATQGRFPAVRTPKFRYQRVRVVSLQLLKNKATLEVDLGVDNDHGSTIDLSRFDYSLSLGGKRVATGLIDRLGEVPGATEEILTIPVEVDLLGTGSSVIAALTGKGKLNVGLDADVDVDTPFGILPLHVDETGLVQVE
ncbi:MAG: LEA14-like dessication related protein [Kiritimatiellia bacterium]|jgi:LEA14-like dessication related protein